MGYATSLSVSNPWIILENKITRSKFVKLSVKNLGI